MYLLTLAQVHGITWHKVTSYVSPTYMDFILPWLWPLPFCPQIWGILLISKVHQCSRFSWKSAKYSVRYHDKTLTDEQLGGGIKLENHKNVPSAVLTLASPTSSWHRRQPCVSDSEGHCHTSVSSARPPDHQPSDGGSPSAFASDFDTMCPATSDK